MSADGNAAQGFGWWNTGFASANWSGQITRISPF
jgi:hypothetical protein